VPSPAEALAALPDEQRDAFLASLTEDEKFDLLHDWRGFLAREDQIAPDGDWDIWLVMSGRGFGKTRTGAEWVKGEVAAGRAGRIALIAETAADGRDVMAEGESGILAVYPKKEDRPLYEPSKRRITWQNGAVATIYNATEPDQLRGPQHDLAWSDELAKWKYARETWDQLQFGLRLGEKPRQLVTTTPRPIELIKALVSGSEGKVHITRGRTMDNRINLAASFLEKIEAKYAGTRLGRQELNGEILGDIPNALWTLANIDTARIKEHPATMRRIYVAIDPAISNTEQSDEHGIIVVGQSADGKDGYVLEDASLKGSPLDWAKRALSVHDRWQADGIAVEVNQGGDMVAQTIRSVRAGVKIVEVRATRGKHVRAEPIAALYEQGRIHHVGAFIDLETQMTQMTTFGFEGDGSPDRVDALVWGLSVLFPSMVREDKSRIKAVPPAVAMPMARR
jgi:phage terminase large subunit-like protein